MYMLLALGGITCLGWGTMLWLSFFDERQAELIGMPLRRGENVVPASGR